VRTIDFVAGARPNFMKLSPVLRAIETLGLIDARIIHTGQHYDYGMNEVFFKQLGIPEPHVHLEVGSGSHGAQTARILERYEAHLLKSPPIATVVFGDVNSTIACALASVKLGIPVVHVEAGLRSRDRTMPEEINRILTDAVADLLLVSEPSGITNLEGEGVARDKIRFVGNVMIDVLVRELPRAEALKTYKRLGLKRRAYGLVTVHRPSNADDPAVLERLLLYLRDLSGRLPIVFPVHPRTRNAAKKAGLEKLLSTGYPFVAVEPLPYLENLCLMASAAMVLTDSGGMQEETSFLKIPCLTLRENTERPVTIQKGTSRLVGNDIGAVKNAVDDILQGRWPPGEEIELWDGHASERVAASISERFCH